MIQKPTTLHIYLNKIVLHQLTCGSLNQINCHVELFSVMTCCPTIWRYALSRRTMDPAGSSVCCWLSSLQPITPQLPILMLAVAVCEAALWPCTPCSDTSPHHKASNVAMRPVHLSEGGKVQVHLTTLANRDRLNNILQIAMPGILGQV